MNTNFLFSDLKYILLIILLSLKLMAFDHVDTSKNMHFFILENGMQVYIKNDQKTIKTKISVEVNVGMDVENNDNAGISHLLEHLIFRDERVPHNKYVRYLQGEGARYVYGFTSQHMTEYLATIDNKKSYWLVKTFANMIFDKKINQNDLEVEKNALQVEIGNLKWYHAPLYYLSGFVKWVSNLFPSMIDIYHTTFSHDEGHSLPIDFYFMKNNKEFTLEQIMEHYDKYYYPSNMILKVAGNFDEKKMMETIYNSFGSIKKLGTLRENKHPLNTVLNY